MLYVRAALVSLVILASQFVQAAPLPYFLRDGNSRFLARSLGSACFTMDSVQRNLPCNPAAIAKERKPRFDADLFMGSNMDYLRDAENILSGTSSEEDTAKVFARRESSQAEASIELSYQQPKWGVGLEPYRLLIYSTFENPALPMVDMIAAEEQSARVQFASYVHENFYAGLQLRYSHIRFVGRYFAISELLTNDDGNFFEPETQELFYFEPGFLYAWEGKPWRPQVSLAFMNWGFSDSKSETYPIHPEVQFGASVKPTVPLGLLEVGLQFSLHSETSNVRDAIRGAVAYQLGILQAVLAASDIDQSAGFLVGYKEFTGGLSYWHEEDHQGVFIQLGVSL